MTRLHVVTAGLCDLVQDLGRPGYAHLGIPPGGAADPLSLEVGNRLVGNEPRAAGLELTLQGGAYAVDGPATVAVTGGVAAVVVESRGERRATSRWSALTLARGDILRVGAIRRGARAYLAVRGGITVSLVLGSASTLLAAALGGHAGRCLVRGDVLAIGPEPARGVGRLVATRAIETLVLRSVLRVVDGAQADWFAPAAHAALAREPYEVSAASDRVGLRLEGARLGLERSDALVTEGVSLGAIQVPEGGAPIVLGVDHPTTGGYPKIAHVIAADLAVLGQLRPSSRLRFVRVGDDRARETLAERRKLVERAVAAW